jgi:hypothetical protein
MTRPRRTKQRNDVEPHVHPAKIRKSPKNNGQTQPATTQAPRNPPNTLRLLSTVQQLKATQKTRKKKKTQSKMQRKRKRRKTKRQKRKRKDKTRGTEKEPPPNSQRQLVLNHILLTRIEQFCAVSALEEEGSAG